MSEKLLHMSTEHSSISNTHTLRQKTACSMKETHDGSDNRTHSSYAAKEAAQGWKQTCEKGPVSTAPGNREKGPNCRHYQTEITTPLFLSRFYAFSHKQEWHGNPTLKALDQLHRVIDLLLDTLSLLRRLGYVMRLEVLVSELVQALHPLLCGGRGERAWEPCTGIMGEYMKGCVALSTQLPITRVPPGKSSGMFKHTLTC